MTGFYTDARSRQAIYRIDEEAMASEYLDEEGEWVNDPSITRYLVEPGADTDIVEISEAEAREIADLRGISFPPIERSES